MQEEADVPDTCSVAMKKDSQQDTMVSEVVGDCGNMLLVPGLQ